MIENYGLIALKDDYIEVKIIASVFKNMLIENHFQDVNNVVNALRDKGFIESDHDRITTKRTVKDDNGKKTVTCLLPFKARFKIYVYFWSS